VDNAADDAHPCGSVCGYRYFLRWPIRYRCRDGSALRAMRIARLPVVARHLKIGLGTLAVLLIVIGVWVAILQHARPSAGASMSSPVKDQAWDGRAAKRTEAPRKATKDSSLWAKPPAEVAARNYRRQGFAWILRQLGASEEQLNRLSDQDLLAVFLELKQKAQGGDTAAINILGEIALQNCGLGRNDDTLEAYATSQIADAQAFPPKDAAWFTAAMHEDSAFEKRVNVACKQVIDQDEILSWVAARAAQGDGASSWLLSRTEDNLTNGQQRLRDAAAAGFPEAQFELAWAIIGGQQGAGGTGSAKVNAGDLLRQSADQLPRAKEELAVCEYFGLRWCRGRCQCRHQPCARSSATRRDRRHARHGTAPVRRSSRPKRSDGVGPRSCVACTARLRGQRIQCPGDEEHLGHSQCQ